MMWESFLVKLMLGEGEESKRGLPDGLWPVIFGKNDALLFSCRSSATFGILDCRRALLTLDLLEKGGNS